MKRTLLSISFSCLLILAVQHQGFAGVAHSIAGGGQWNNASTWIEDFVPGPNDTAYITSPVGIGTVVGYDIYHTYGGWVIVEPTGQLYPIDYGGGLGIFILYIEHDIVNNGRITNAYGVRNEELLNINVKGNVTNNNYWRAYQTDLSGTGNQNLILADGKSFGGIWTCTSPHSITALSNMWFDCIYSYGGIFYTADFNMNGSVLHMGNFSINCTGTLIYKGTFEGNFEILGNFRVNKFVEDTLVFQGNVTVTDTLESNIYGGGYGIQKLKIIGNIVNNGVVRDREDGRNADDLNILITGNITNNGKWTCNYVNFIGTEPQTIVQSPGKQFVSNFYDLDASSGIVANSDLAVTQNVYLNGGLLDMQGHMLTLPSWLFNGTIRNAQLNGGNLQSVTATESLSIYGMVTIDNDNVFDCSVIVEDTLRSNTYGGGSCFFDLTINGDLTNNGLIKNYDPGHWFRIYTTGNISNNGGWMNYTTIFTGDGNQTIDQASGTNYGCDFESQKSQGDLVAINNLNILGNFNLNSSKLMMGGHSLFAQNWIYNGILDNSTLHGGILQSLTCTGNLIVDGKVTLDDNNIMNCNLTVNDTLQCNTYGGGSKFYDVTIDGSVSNFGVIKSYGSGMLRLFITGNLLNAGEWVNYLTYVKVVGDMTIELIDNLPIAGSVQFEAMIESNTYQWYFNDVVLDSPDFEGETSKVLTWNVPVSADWYGSFYCETGSKERVGITVKDGFVGINENSALHAGIWSFDHSLNIDFQEGQPGEVFVFDLTGRKIDCFKVEKGTTISQLDNPGLYIVQVRVGGKVACKKVLIR